MIYIIFVEKFINFDNIVYLMEAKLIFLGTGGGKYVPAKQIRSTGGFILQYGETQLHIDPGPGALVKAKEFDVNPRNTIAILCSHAHLNHCNDVNAVISAMTYSGEDKHGVLISSESVINGCEDIPPYLTPFHASCLEKIITLELGQKIAINEIEIQATKCRHKDKTAIGFKIRTPHFTIGYTSDTDYLQQLEKEFSKSDILILNVLDPFHYKTRGNLNSEEAIKVINKVRPKLAIIQHFDIKMLNVNPLYEARDIKKQTKIEVIAARDGLIINPMLYSKRNRQETLK